MSRRHAAGAESARGLLFTVLGEFVLPCGGTAWTDAFIDVLGRLGVTEKAARQALMRTAADGWLTSQRVGRRTRWQLTARARQLLDEGTERIYGFTTPAANWDGRWLLVLARTPETDRAARHLLRTRLSWAGLGSPAPGVWVGAHVERRAAVEDVLRQARVFDDGQVFLAEHVGGAQEAAMVRAAWDLDAIDAGYRQFLATFGDRVGGEPLAGMVELVHAWRRFPWVDPVLPPGLLPPRWRGRAALTRFESLHARWGAPAMAEWRRVAGESAD